jgi:hypothetical protein
MSLSDAERYGRLARDAKDVPELGDNTDRAIEALVQTIKELQVRISRLEAAKPRGSDKGVWRTAQARRQG